MAARNAKPSAGRSLWERQRDAIRAGKAAPPIAPEPQAPEPPPAAPAPPAQGEWPIEALRFGQCRFACTPDDVPRDAHRFCGAATELGPGNRHGSWCPEHLARITDKTGKLGRPVFLVNALKGNRP